MIGGHYILDVNHQPVLTDLLSWAHWFETADRVVARTRVEGADISTVFLGLDHNFGSGAPLLFETMIFGGPHDQHCDRYSTWEEAVAGHARAVALAQTAERAS